MATKNGQGKAKKMKTVILIPVEGEIALREIDGSLDSMQALVGGYIEPIRLDGRTTLYVNEEGLLNGLRPNPRASHLALRPIVGDTFIENPSKNMLASLVASREDRV